MRRDNIITHQEAMLICQDHDISLHDMRIEQPQAFGLYGRIDRAAFLDWVAAQTNARRTKLWTL
jgi:hypothetical protein